MKNIKRSYLLPNNKESNPRLLIHCLKLKWNVSSSYETVIKDYPLNLGQSVTKDMEHPD